MILPGGTGSRLTLSSPTEGTTKSRVAVWYLASVSATLCGPCVTALSAMGVEPTGCSSRRTVAPDGFVRIVTGAVAFENAWDSTTRESSLAVTALKDHGRNSDPEGERSTS